MIFSKAALSGCCWRDDSTISARHFPKNRNGSYVAYMHEFLCITEDLIRMKVRLDLIDDRFTPALRGRQTIEQALKTCYAAQF